MSDWRGVSLWMDQLQEPLQPRPALTDDLQVDVAIIGAGYTGLWTAYYLKRLAPHLNVAIVEAQIAGFGASGRNGGWLMGNLLGEDRLLGTLPPAARAQSFDLLHDIPDEVARICTLEGIDCDLRKGGVLYCAARYPEQEPRLRAQLEHYRALGLGETDYRWLDRPALASQVKIANAYAGLYSPHCATIQPAKLVRGPGRAPVAHRRGSRAGRVGRPGGRRLLQRLAALEQTPGGRAEPDRRDRAAGRRTLGADRLGEWPGV
jgi:glycine/D-amino acid oxidase-like deaminating enzyme